jgi:hypothetical protein
MQTSSISVDADLIYRKGNAHYDSGSSAAQLTRSRKQSCAKNVGAEAPLWSAPLLHQMVTESALPARPPHKLKMDEEFIYFIVWIASGNAYNDSGSTGAQLGVVGNNVQKNDDHGTEQAKQVRLSEEKKQNKIRRQCALPGCGVAFVPRTLSRRQHPGDRPSVGTGVCRRTAAAITRRSTRIAILAYVLVLEL